MSGTGKATDFTFGGYIYKANPNKSWNDKPCSIAWTPSTVTRLLKKTVIFWIHSE